MGSKPPLIVVVAGPNGAGKSTTAPLLLQKALAVKEFVNADAIALGLSAFRPETVAIDAGRVMLKRIKTLAENQEDFAFETTLASRTFAPWLKDLRSSGYRVHLAFLSLPNFELALARVAERVRSGGHNVPKEIVTRRFTAGLKNFFTIYQKIADVWQLFDNSELREPHLIAHGKHGKPAVVIDKAAWNNLQERQT
jgi:predicted ABC-type ATPase